ncbi:GNAT family N-acetyltransferase [Actinoplanes sp. Pm04-4]|uniref:GNAT family N-acetyltransferase n=1 Tax=Paractinoplanes pyxinae TaxID=2997416 RepID=A0ABT4BEZ9_9ACTN|nr:GNAT family N-acetyltransferase [Actinoplanes pyxinae]MCY1145119.1 GNAT family N-acetyltransferase [Actinoplanes pyxinae]
MSGTRFTERLRLEPVDADRASDLWLVMGDDAVWPWYGGAKPAYAEIEQSARDMGDSWRRHGVHKWIAYERDSGEVVGRGGLSRTPVDDDWGQLYAFLPDEPWVRAVHGSERPCRAHADWLELGWAVRGKFRRQGYATEIGRAGLAYAFEVLKAKAVVSCTLRHNASSRAVMARLGLRYAGEIVSGGDPYAVSVTTAGPRPDRSRA